MGEKVLSVIPARKGSKGIPRKNVREFGDRPLVGHAIETCRESELIDTVAVTTDSQEIAQIGRRFDADVVIDRPKQLAADEVPLAPVIEHAFAEVDGEFDYVLCHQPTVPLIRPVSVDSGIRAGIQQTADSVVFVVDSTHHYWKQTDDGFEAVSSDRENRQLMEPIYGEIGVFLSHRDLVTRGKRIGGSIEFHTVDHWEGIDIDTYADWQTAESHRSRKQLVYRVTGNDQNGTGHIYRGITLADHLFEHDIVFAVEPNDNIAIDMLEGSNYDYQVFDDNASFVNFIEETSPFVVVNDILDTTADYVTALRAAGSRVVNFEDLGDGTEHADAVINALYEHSNPPENHYYGFKYFCLRGEFRYATQKSEISSVDRIMISFGGIDENNLTARTLQALAELDDQLYVDVVLGLGYADPEQLDPIVEALPDNLQVEINQQVQSMAQRMEQADLLITSNGRTLYEAGSLNLPVLSIAQNAREQKHPYAFVSRGVLSLGQAAYVSEEMIRTAVTDYITDETRRETMRTALADHDIANGIERIKQIVFDETHENR
ncbi:cytidylyltransferase domain-containing protein [Halorubrum pallidum]|uniref:Cytidylyltransferase domain-containing protein n=1 Tax=Halorubrum pallidum TaxID=1526114 RepID=A0ABD5SY95_9EURY